MNIVFLIAILTLLNLYFFYILKIVVVNIYVLMLGTWITWSVLLIYRKDYMWLLAWCGFFILRKLEMFLDVYIVLIMLWISFLGIFLINVIILLRYAKQFNSLDISALQKIFWVLQMILMISSIYYGFLNDPYFDFFTLYRLDNYKVTWDFTKDDFIQNVVPKLKEWWCLINKLEYRLIFYKNIGINWNVFSGFCLFLLLLLQKELLKFLLILVQWHKDRKLKEFCVKFFVKLNLLLFVVVVVMFFFL